MPEYPPQPWNLAGNAYLSVWSVPRSGLPRVPATVRPLTIGGNAVVFTAWIDYQPPGQLAYHELLSTVAVRNGPRATGSITEIWVDSEISLAGGRELWAIPKDLATLEFAYGRGFTASASAGDDWIATAAFSPRPGPPVRLPANFAIAQSADGRPLVSDVRSKGKPHAAAASWNINPGGPLGYLAGRRPLLSAHLGDFRIRFGA
ncbi:acetoacetate decarboxylase family protein [Prauserella cavernicola]|uniref:Acetoacetate decarboxylase family protein n=1 Tax=Prauserella cavernicola TaxID=2800127 RepID=A0A934QXD7_9PSEU|nr:acetoacetate decarboxylase family protein [Prauserella cavernicola]MBK1788241.1 acetoacetate decarboxylase family protein [Prauserella cavernicola]